MKYLTLILLMNTVVFTPNSLHAQPKISIIEEALFIARKNQNQLENVKQLLIVYNYKPESFNAVFVALEKKGKNWEVKQKPIAAGIGKNGFALPNQKVEG
ncbi:MAG: hypothetical protein JHC39_03705, partial [Lentimicrobium sp.]|nr:hypothetical protein [Lentimicrobium sp.]